MGAVSNGVENVITAATVGSKSEVGPISVTCNVPSRPFGGHYTILKRRAQSNTCSGTTEFGVVQVPKLTKMKLIKSC